MSDFLLAGATIRFEYPSANYVCAKPKLERRRLQVATIRDTFTEPLKAATMNANPCLARGRYLVTGLDLDKGEERSFYLESMQGVSELPKPKYGGEESPPPMFAVVDIKQSRVVARALSASEAIGFSLAWPGQTTIAPEAIKLPSDDQVIERLR